MPLQAQSSPLCLLWKPPSWGYEDQLGGWKGKARVLVSFLLVQSLFLSPPWKLIRYEDHLREWKGKSRIQVPLLVSSPKSSLEARIQIPLSHLHLLHHSLLHLQQLSPHYLQLQFPLKELLSWMFEDQLR